MEKRKYLKYLDANQETDVVPGSKLQNTAVEWKKESPC